MQHVEHNVIFTKEEADDMDATTTSETSGLENYEEVTASDGKKSYRCTVADCGKAFRYKSEISRHLVIHFPSRPYQCKFKGCKKTFKRNDAMENHFRIHAKDLPYSCDFPGCEQKFTTKAGLKYHCLKHNEERLFKCTFAGCNKSFLTASQLKQHQKAFVSHYKISIKQKLEEEEEEEEEHEHEESHTNTPSTEFYSPVHKYAHLNNESTFTKQEEGINTKVEPNSNLQNMLNYVLRENSVLETKLEFCDKLISSFMNRYAVKMEYNGAQDDLWKAPNTFFNNGDSVFLDYLRERTQENM